MSSAADRVLQAYIKKFKQLPDQPNQLVSFSRTDGEIPTIIYSEAKKTLTKIKTSIKTGKIKKKSFKTSTKYSVGDEVLISKDRTGILKFIGKVPEMGDDKIYYGLELTSGTLGQNDGAVKGKRYFQTTGKRGMFVPERKLRRRLNKKDKERRNSYVEVSSQVKELQKSYAGDDAAWLYHGNSVTNPEQAQNIHSLVFETAEPQQNEQYGNGDGDGDGRESTESTEETEEITPKIKKVSRKNTKKSVKKSSKHKKKASRQRRNSQRSHSSHSSRYDKNETQSSTESVSELDETDSKDGPTVKTFDTLLKYILRQKGGYREGLLDVYANPKTQPLISEAFSQMKQLHPAEQAFLWPALLKRWSKYLHRV